MTIQQRAQLAADGEPRCDYNLAVRYYNQGAKETLERAMEFWRNELDMEVDETYKQWVEEKLAEFENEMKGE